MQYKDLAYSVVLTTAKPQLLPATIVEENEADGIYPVQESHEFLQDDNQPSYEISEETNTISPLIANFQNLSYSTLWNQSSTRGTKKTRTNNFQENNTKLKLKKPLYSTIYHNY
ncbi:hypothetical protein QE152_g19416 [Popillia japonica]|uniref:Uncharacterized protein n=1 Tax=Popillia japonica TaxID=7064 RepID=A0AAW1KP20_POPJA